MLKIGDFSKLSRISIRMLRHYNEIGLLIPEVLMISQDIVITAKHNSLSQIVLQH